MIFSSCFPKAHPRAGEPTDFATIIPAGHKIHTCRAHDEPRYKVGNVYLFNIWTGKPYRSPQARIGGYLIQWWCRYRILDSDRVILESPDGNEEYWSVKTIAENDGLSAQDWLDWMKDAPQGIIYGWTENPYQP